MMKNTKRFIVFIVALFFLVLGLIGLVVPLMPQVIFLAIGLLLISMLSPSVRAWMDKHTVKYPKIHNLIIKVDAWIKGVIGEV